MDLITCDYCGGSGRIEEEMHQCEGDPRQGMMERAKNRFWSQQCPICKGNGRLSNLLPEAPAREWLAATEHLVDRPVDLAPWIGKSDPLGYEIQLGDRSFRGHDPGKLLQSVLRGWLDGRSRDAGTGPMMLTFADGFGAKITPEQLRYFRERYLTEEIKEE